MNYIDIIIAVLLIYAFIRGIINGFFAEIAGLIGVIAGIYFAINYSFYIEDYLTNSDFFNWSDTTNKVVAFCATFFIVVLIIVLIGKILTKIANIAALGIVNKILGGLFGVFKTGLILSVFFILFNSFNDKASFIDKETLDDSIFYNRIKNIAPAIFPTIIEEYKDDNEELTIPEENEMI